jgi:hypothetical protein
MNCLMRKMNAIISLGVQESVYSNSDHNTFDVDDIHVKNFLICHNVKAQSLQRPVK